MHVANELSVNKHKWQLTWPVDIGEVIAKLIKCEILQNWAFSYSNPSPIHVDIVMARHSLRPLHI